MQERAYLTSMKNSKNTIVAAVLLIFFALPPSPAEAQKPPSFNETPITATLQGISVTLTPPVPRPRAQAEISLKSVRRDLSRTMIVWKRDGKVVRSGRGATRFSFTAGAAGETSTISFSVSLDGTLLYADTVTIRPSELKIAWEAETYTPPFYRGKALFVPESRVRFIALPYVLDEKGSVVDPSKLTYTWKQGRRTLLESSGYGKQVLELQGSVFKSPLSVTVEVSDAAGSFYDSAEVTVPPSLPTLRLYARPPLLGTLYRQSLASLALGSTEETFVVEPYFFSVPSRNHALLDYEWRLNGRQFNAGSVITFSRPTEGTGSDSLSLRLRNKEALLQFAQWNSVVSF